MKNLLLLILIILASYSYGQNTALIDSILELHKSYELKCYTQNFYCNPTFEGFIDYISKLTKPKTVIDSWSINERNELNIRYHKDYGNDTILRLKMNMIITDKERELLFNNINSEFIKNLIK